MRNIHVRFGCAPSAQRELVFAIDLARRISGRLFVWTMADRPAASLLDVTERPSAKAREHAHVRDRVRLEVGRHGAPAPIFCEGDPRGSVRDPDSIVIWGRDDEQRPVGASIFTMGEMSVVARGGGEICVPFANGASALDAVDEAIPLAAKLGTSLLLYHTTWREDGVPDDAPAERHMSAEAEAILVRLRKASDDGGVKHRTLIETASAVVEGAVRAAQMAHCAMMAVARTKDVGYGSHVDQVLERSVMPVLVAGRSAR